MIKWVLPFYYTIKSRILTKKQWIEYIMIYFIFSILLFVDLEISIGDIYKYIIGFLGMISIYEIGYLRNDFITIKRESSPNIRGNNKDRNEIEENLNKVIYLKYFFCLVAVVALQSYYYALGVLAIEVAYLIHNNFRGKITYISFFLLTILRYLVPFLGIEEANLLHLLLNIMIMMAIPRTIEKIFSRKNLKVNKDVYLYYIYLLRAIYYVLIICLLVFIYKKIYYLWIMLVMYRSVIFLGVYKNGRKN